MTLIEILIMYFVLVLTAFSIFVSFVACLDDARDIFFIAMSWLIFAFIPLNIVVFY